MKIAINSFSRKLDTKEEVLRIEENILRLQFYYQFKASETKREKIKKFIKEEVLEDIGKMVVMAEMLRYKYDCGMIEEVKDLIESLISGYDFYMKNTQDIEINEELYKGWKEPQEEE